MPAEQTTAVTFLTARGDTGHVTRRSGSSKIYFGKEVKEAFMVHTDFLFLALLVMVLYLAQWESGHWKH